MPDTGVLLVAPFTLDPSTVLSSLGLAEPGELMDEVLGILVEAAPLLRPKSFHIRAGVNHVGPDAVDLDGIGFANRILASKLAGTAWAYPYVATCGTEVGALYESTADPLLRYALDCAKEAALRTAIAHLTEYLGTAYGEGHLASMSPGSGDANLWPIGQQRPLFRLLSGHGDPAGVTLTDSLLMVPNKSVSGILFPSEKSFESCRLCKREKCPNRVTPFDAEAWAAAGMDGGRTG